MTTTDAISKFSDSVDERKRDEHLRLWEAWRTRNRIEFDQLLTEDVDKKVVEALLLNIISDSTQAAKIFATIIFEKDAHRKTFETGKSLLSHVIERGNWQILELLLSFYPNMRQSSEEGNTSLHYLCGLNWDENKEMFKKCMNALLSQSETDVNALNNNENTPIDIAIDTNNRDAIELLLKKSRNVLYLDGVASKRLTPRQRLLETYPDLKDRLPPEVHQKITGSALALLLKKKEEKEFCASFQLALHDESLKNLISTKKHEFLQQACADNLPDAIKLLMDNGADPSYIDKWNDFRSSIIIAIEKGNLEILPLLLEKASVPKYKNTHKQQIDVNHTDREGNTALHYAAHYGNETAILEILKFGGYMGAENLKQETPLKRIPHDVLEQFLDRNIKTTVNKDELTFKYFFLKRPELSSAKDSESQEVRNSSAPEMKLLNDISKIEHLRPLLLHPVLSSFTLLKWQRLKLIFILNLSFYVILTTCLTFNILYTSINTEVLESTRGLQNFLLVLLLLRELFQGIVNPKRYILQSENCLEITLIVLASYLSITDCTDSETCQHIGACVILISWFEFLLLIGKLPMFSVQVEMFLIVSSSFVKFLYIYLIMVLAFALSFFVLFHASDDSSVNEFSNIGTSIFKTLIMISGEFDATDMPFSIYPFTSHFIFILFVFMVAIVLLNLLNGLAVYDTQLIKTDALLHSYVSRIKYLTSLEYLLNGFQNWSVCKYFLEFEDSFSSEDVRDIGSVFHGYKMEPKILQRARGIVKNNESERKLREDAEKRSNAINDSEKRSEVIEDVRRTMKGLMKMSDFGDILRRLEDIEKKLELV